METSRVKTKIVGFDFLRKNKQGYEEYQHQKTGIELVLIPAGSFTMGCTNFANEKPVHQVFLKSFLLGKYPVTQEQWQRIMSNNPAHFQNGGRSPVEQVSWEDCQEFCKKTGLILPSEAQWEYACRAGTNTEYYWGDDVDEGYVHCRKKDGEDAKSTIEVGLKKPNGFGLYDMSGNVWEWCQDVYAENYNNAPNDGSAYTGEGESYVIRGGSWDFQPVYCRSANRLRACFDDRENDLGFRVSGCLDDP